jgi:hypothetical protein
VGDIDLAVVVEVRVALASEAEVVFVTVFVVGVFWGETGGVRVDLYELEVLDLNLEVFDEFTEFGLDVAFPDDELLEFLAHDA